MSDDPPSGPDPGPGDGPTPGPGPEDGGPVPGPGQGPDTDADGSSAPEARIGALERLYRRVPALLMARRNLSRNRVRSALATLGIVIGVLAIASLGMFGTTLRIGADQQLGDIGNEIQVSPNQEAGVRNLTGRDVTQMRRVAGEGTVVPVKRGVVTLERGRERSVVTAYGIERPGALYTAADGRIPETLRQGVLVGADVADRFDLVAGNTVTLRGETYRVVAVLEREDGITLLDPNGAVVVPPGDVGGDTYDQAVVTAPSGEAANRSAVAIREALNRREERVTIFELQSITQGINRFFGILNAFLVGVGSISLIVAGVSILNVMLMSTVERRQEIGVLRAVGVQRGDVLRMILAEAGLLGVAGGVIGAVLSVVAGLALNWFVLDTPMATFRSTNLLYLGLAVGFGLVTSLLSGLYPAWKAANERPVEALRG